MNKEIIVIGGNHHNTLAVLRSLGEKGVKSLLIVVSEESNPYVSYSKYIMKAMIIKDINDISKAMYSIHVSQEKAIVIACSDSIASYLDDNYSCLAKDFILPGSSVQGKITRFMNKNTMLEEAVKSGLNIPKSWVITSSSRNVEDIVYPCIVKPLISKNGTKSDITICDNRKELEKYLEFCNCNELQVQEYISKDMEFQLIGCSLDSGNDVIIPGVSIILRQPENTNTGFLKYIPIREFLYDKDACVKFLKHIGYSGLFSLEFIRDKNGVDFFMEINFRNDGNSICVTASGMNLPYIWYLYNSGQSYSKELTYESMKEVIVMPEFEDFANVKNGNISLFKWLLDVKNTDRFMEFSKYDQKPFWKELLRLGKSKIFSFYK